jgi:hypothetical protein
MSGHPCVRDRINSQSICADGPMGRFVQRDCTSVESGRASDLGVKGEEVFQIFSGAAPAPQTGCVS